jgi:thioredoxin-like negative regulator of GroEL
MAMRALEAPGRAALTGESEVPESPLVVEFTSRRAAQRPLAARAGGIELAPATRLPVRAVDIDRHPELRRAFRVTLLPTFVVVHAEGELARFVGPHTRRELASAIRRALDPRIVRLPEPPRARGKWNDFTVRLWGFVSA